MRCRYTEPNKNGRMVARLIEAMALFLAVAATLYERFRLYTTPFLGVSTDKLKALWFDSLSLPCIMLGSNTISSYGG